MTDIIVQQMPAFKKAFKKLSKQAKFEAELAIKQIVLNPKIGQEKKGALAGVYVYKFKINRQEMLLAYEWDPKSRLLLWMGVHQNFYRDLKR